MTQPESPHLTSYLVSHLAELRQHLIDRNDEAGLEILWDAIESAHWQPPAYVLRWPLEPEDGTPPRHLAT